MTVAFDIDPQLVSTMTGVCGPYCDGPALARSEQVGWSPELWMGLDVLGLTGVGVAESIGGSGGSEQEAAELVRVAAYLGAPVPLAERCLVAGPLYEAAGLPLPEGPIAVAPGASTLTASRSGAGLTVSGSLRSVAAGRIARWLVTDVDEAGTRLVVALELASGVLVENANYAGEPRDEISFDDVEVHVVAENAGDVLLLLGARARAVQMAGALERILEMTLTYAQQREQFGRPIAEFQAVAHQLALLAECTANARMAAEIAVVSESREDAMAAKIVAGEAATTGAAIAHQVHGALGFTRECDLQHLTRRLWSWRDEFGSESRWAQELGGIVASRATDELWRMIAG